MKQPASQSSAGAESNRLVGATAIAMGVHIAVILGINFTLLAAPPPQPVYSLNVALVQQAGGEAGDSGGTPLPPLQPEPFQPIAPVDPAASTQALQMDTLDLVATDGNAAQAVPVSDLQAVIVPESEAPPASTMPEPMRLARLETTQREHRDDNRERYIDPNDKTTLEGFYAEKWRLKVQELGTQHFPAEARQLGLTGRLTLDVAIRADGTLQSIKVLRSSGHRILDNAAHRTVLLATPFEPFPEALRRRYDVLHIVRTWEFDQGDRLQAGH